MVGVVIAAEAIIALNAKSDGRGTVVGRRASFSLAAGAGASVGGLIDQKDNKRASQSTNRLAKEVIGSLWIGGQSLREKLVMLLTYVSGANNGQEGEGENEESDGTHVDGRRVWMRMLKWTSGLGFGEAKLCCGWLCTVLAQSPKWGASSPAC